MIPTLPTTTGSLGFDYNPSLPSWASPDVAAIVNGLAAFGVIACLIGFIIGAVSLAMAGGHHQEMAGKKIFASLIAVGLITLAPLIITWVIS